MHPLTCMWTDGYFRWRGVIPIPAYLPLLLVAWKEFRNPWVTWPAGLALILAGFALRLFAVRHLGKSVRSPQMVARKLVTSGPYAWTRNPVYLATLLLAAGFAVSSKLLWYAPALVLLLAVHYSIVARAEEGKLGELYGDEFRAYAARVSRWLPTRPASPAPGTPEPWSGVFRREWKLGVAIVAGVGLIVLKGLVGWKCPW